MAERGKERTLMDLNGYPFSSSPKVPHRDVCWGFATDVSMNKILKSFRKKREERHSWKVSHFVFCCTTAGNSSAVEVLTLRHGCLYTPFFSLPLSQRAQAIIAAFFLNSVISRKSEPHQPSRGSSFISLFAFVMECYCEMFHIVRVRVLLVLKNLKRQYG
ncbi:hypothetical protein BDV95DRAFT_6289 [Massariosphaeria phaeospora]|uniref:Uncharacterized protein n=1 Tax=Massariosphaeria phaeospora TaxID=100035 RepID=A0A7C8MVB9_9PLEO|nr:hypothetical protein BDV95DRAFT_6289 [Massariosphaeria phaeospora]